MGVILGTAAYMSPEQARGKPVDKRADIWAFGAVLYEMLTGHQVFGRETISDTMAAILKEEPVWEALNEATPAAVVRVLGRCLTKDPRERLHDIADARIELADAHTDPEATDASRAPAWRTPVAAAVLAVVALVAGFWLGEAWQSPPESNFATPGTVARLEIELPAEASLGFGTTALGFDSPLLAISPDGKLIVYVGRSSSGTRLYRRRIDSFADPEPIDGTDGALFAFFSPNGEWLGFLTNEAVKKVSLRAGDRPQIVSKARVPTHAEWAANGTIYFAEDEGLTLSSVPEAGGPVTEIDRLGRGGIQTYLSDVLPNGTHGLIQTSSESISNDYANIYLLSLETLDRTLLIERGYGARYVTTGHLLFARAGTLYAVPFDASSLEVSGEPLPVIPGVSMESLFGQVQVAFSDGGALIYAPGGDRSVGRIAAVERYTNEVEFLDLPERVYGYFELSPDGSRIAAQVADINDYISIWDRSARTARKLVAPGSAGWPIWSPDGREIAYTASIPGQGRGIFMTSGVREDEPRQILASEGRVYPVSWHPDLDILGVVSFDGRMRFGFLQIGAGEVDWASRTDASEGGGGIVFLRDGLATSSNRTGRYEVRVRSYPDVDEFDRQISSTGGLEPDVCRDCDEIFYRDGNRWFSHTVTLGETPTFGPAELVFETDFIDTPGRSYDVSADGQQLFVVKSTRTQTTTKLHVIQNWFEELKRLAPRSGN
jgi:serine/threonine-protein kinase